MSGEQLPVQSPAEIAIDSNVSGDMAAVLHSIDAAQQERLLRATETALRAKVTQDMRNRGSK